MPTESADAAAQELRAPSSKLDTPDAARAWRSTAQRNKRTRRFDFAIAISASVAAHVGLLMLSDEPGKTTAPAQPPATVLEALVFEMPEPEETPVDITDSEPPDAPAAEFAPPMQADLPSIVSVDSFVQPMQPPVASGLATDIGMMVVPTTVAIGHGGNAPKLFEIAELDRIPNRIRTGMLSYPQEFRRSKKEGTVVLLVVIDPTGHVKVDRVLESTHPEFARAATTAAEQSLYESPRKGGAAVSARYTLRVPFRLTAD